MARALRLLAASAVATSVAVTGIVLTNIGVSGPSFSVLGGEATYVLTVTASDLAKGYATTTSGAHIAFETSNVTNVDGVMTFEEAGYFRFTDRINGTTKFTVVPSGELKEDALILSSGYSVNGYGAAEYLSSTHLTIDTYYRTFFELSTDEEGVALSSFSITYTCQTHYAFMPLLANKTETAALNTPVTFDDPTYVLNIVPNMEEVDIVKEHYTFTFDGKSEPIYTFHPTVKYYDKGGCLIRQVSAVWVVHIDPVVRFHTSTTEYVDFTCELNSNFNLSKLNSGVLSSFDWSAYTEGDGALTKPLVSNLDLYPKVTININPGVNSTDDPSSIVFTPNPELENFGFPAVAAPNVREGYHFSRWYNADEVYDPAKATDFHDYDLYATYSSDFDLRLRFINRGFDSPYFETGIPEDESFNLADASSHFIDQSTTGIQFAAAQGYFIYPEGHREDGEHYEAGASFHNDGKGTSQKPAVYIAEPATYIAKENNTFGFSDYADATVVSPMPEGVPSKGYSVINYNEYGENDRSYRKILTLPDYVKEDSELKGSPFNTWSYSDLNDPTDFDPSKVKGIGNSKELEKLVGNDAFYYVGQAGFANNAALQELEYFPKLAHLGEYAFFNCHKLKPIQEWKGIGELKTIGTHAFDQCYDEAVFNEDGQRIRRRIEIPRSVTRIEGLAFGGASQTDFDFNPIDFDETCNISSWRSFGYGTNPGSGAGNSHSPEFAEVLTQWRNAPSQDKASYLPALRLKANRVVFHGTKTYYESLCGGKEYDDAEMVKQLTENEYYVVFVDD